MAYSLKGLFSKRSLFVLSLDGVPYTFMKEQIGKGLFPNMERLFQDGSFRRMYSVLPPVSSVAWSTYMTGKNPAGHNIFGFIDREPGTMKLFIPTGSHMKAKAFWERLSEEGKKVVVINVPVTSPPRPVNGVLISGFLAPSLEKGVYPLTLLPRLKEWGYQIDIDAQKAREDRGFLIEDLNRSTKARFETATHLMEEEEWSFFHLHVMGTDRINHFLWRRWEDGDQFFAPAFEDYYRSIDRFVGEKLLPFLESRKDTALVVLSDHGFCRLKKEVFLNQWLQDKGLLRLASPDAKSVESLLPDTVAYSLIPGRIYLNLKGREPKGSIDPKNAQGVLQELKRDLMMFRDPETGDQVINAVYMRDEIYKGPYISQAPDMFVLPQNGYDLKGNVNQPGIMQESVLEGMHTFDDAFLFIRGEDIRAETFSILDVTPTLLSLLRMKPYPDLDGRSLI